MTTLAELADKAQNALDDAGAATWSQAVIEEWCVDAIRDYSRYFPRVIREDISTGAVGGVHEHDLPNDFRDIITVEYPQGEDPPEYLDRLHYQDPYFWNSDKNYDIIARHEEILNGILIVSAETTALETIRIEYVGDHDLDLASGDQITVPMRHEDLLIAYVVWVAWRELASTEMQDPTSNSSLLMAQLFQNAGSAEYDYRGMIDDALKARSGVSEWEVWRMDKWDRSY
jgi:hypothetical protein